MYYEQFIKLGHPVITPDTHSIIPACIHQLIELQQTTKTLQTEAISSKLITDLLTDILLNNVKPNHELHPSLVPDFLVQTADYLEKRYREKITLDRLAAEMKVSKFHLAKTFKKHIGITPYEYLFHIRINAAKALLKICKLSKLQNRLDWTIPAILSIYSNSRKGKRRFNSARLGSGIKIISSISGAT